jgi:hypothetical protein
LLTFTKVVDADTTNFRDFIKSIVDEFSPHYKEKAIVQYFDDSLQALPEVKTDQDLQLMFDKHVESKVVCMPVVYYDPYEEAPQLVTEWPLSPLKKIGPKKISRMKRTRRIALAIHYQRMNMWVLMRRPFT